MRPTIRRAVLAAATVALLLLSGGQALANHVGCGDAITQDTKLDSDLVNCPGDGIIIGADNITLDLNGHTIDGVDQGIGVINGSVVPQAEYSHVTIKGGSIQQFRVQVSLLGSFHVVRSLTLRGGGVGILEEFGSRNLIEDNVATGADRGILIGGSANLVTHNTASDSFYGIQIDGGNGNRVIRNSLLRNQAGIEVVDSSTGNRIENNSASQNLQGVLLVDAFRDRLARNSVFGNAVGIRLIRSPGSQILRNVVFSNDQDGIVVEEQNPGAINDVVEGNSVSENGDDGIDADSAETTLTRNTAFKNGDLGIEAVPGVTDGGGNRAFGNGNPLQCLNVFCITNGK